MELRGHTRPNYYKLHALKKADSQRLRGQGEGNWNAKQSKGQEANSGFGDVIKIIDTTLLVWQASAKGLRITTLVPNPLGISSQTHMSYG